MDLEEFAGGSHESAYNDYIHVWEKDNGEYPPTRPGVAEAPPSSIYDPSDIFYSPVLSLNVNVDGTPLMSPPDVTDIPPDFAMPPPFASSPLLQAQQQNTGTIIPRSPSTAPGSTSAPRNPRRNGSSGSIGSVGGRVVKSPHTRTPRWQPMHNVPDLSEIEQIPGPAMQSGNTQAHTDSEPILSQGTGVVMPATIMNLEGFPAGQDPADLEERLQLAIAATARANLVSVSRKSSGGSNSSSRSSLSTPHMRSRTAATSERTSPNVDSSLGDYPFLDESSLNFPSPEKSGDAAAKSTAIGDPRSRKNNHKIAEQERRNRINTAIIELGKLVTPDTPSNSKAATVEAAIDYIQKLRQQVSELQDQIKDFNKSS